MKGSKEFLKLFSFILIGICFNIFLNGISVKADELNSSNIEVILKEIIDTYGNENIVFEDGIVLEVDDKINTSEFGEENLVWKSYNTDILDIVDGQININNSGTTFIIAENNGKYHLREVYVKGYEADIVSYSNNEEPNLNKRSKSIVYIDPGHGGSDPGASGNGVIEKNVVLKVALNLKAILEKNGIEVVMSRTDDTYVSLQDRVITANKSNADSFISVHINSAGVAAAYGIETYYYTQNSPNLASKIQNKLISYTGAYNRGVKKDDFYVITYTHMPSSLAEIGFLSNLDEATKLKDESYQYKISVALAEGILEYLGKDIVVEEDNSNKISSTRIYGNTRYETSYEVFKKGWEWSEYAIFASGTDYPDALCATPLATKYNAPILLVKNASLSSQKELVNLIKEKNVHTIFLVGGTGVLSETIENELEYMGIKTIRLGGSTRYETSVEIAKEVGYTGEITLAFGGNFADGLSMSSIAAKKGMPILLTSTGSLPKVVSDYINSNNFNKIYIVGGSGVISDNIANSLYNVERLGGSTRYDTNKLVFNRFKNELNLDEMYIASALDFADALSASALAGKNSNFVLISDTNGVRQSSIDIINASSDSLKNVYVLGSNKLILDSVLYKLGIDILN